MMPLAMALRDRVGGGRRIRVATTVALAAMGAILGSSALLVAGLIPFETTVVPTGVSAIALLVWVGQIGRAARLSATLSPRLAKAAETIGACGGLGSLLAGTGLLLPAASVAQYVVGGIGALLALPAFFAFPIWLIALAFDKQHAHANRGDLTRIMTRGKK